MASSQEIAKWVETYLITDGSWMSLEDAVNHALERKIPCASIETRTDLAEEHLSYVEDILRNKRALLIQDGGVPSYELDDNDSYICSATIILSGRRQLTWPVECYFR